MSALSIGVLIFNALSFCYQALFIANELLVAKPEAEKMLLALIVNKFSDPDGKVFGIVPTFCFVLVALLTSIVLVGGIPSYSAPSRPSHCASSNEVCGCSRGTKCILPICIAMLNRPCMKRI